MELYKGLGAKYLVICLDKDQEARDRETLGWLAASLPVIAEERDDFTPNGEPHLIRIYSIK